jgi:hypothetical protein
MSLPPGNRRGHSRRETRLARALEQRKRVARRMAHARMADCLLNGPRREGASILRQARNVVDRWEQNGTCITT